jgi:hypothetical protein
LGFCIASAICRHLPLRDSHKPGGERRIKALNGGQWRFKKSLEISPPRESPSEVQSIPDHKKAR